ncbi:MAG TPA: hypothetical protein VMM83_02085 [Longimicrobiales bacterium]|nr:hypothetical protein [Longimicrobiales bacterium]
MRTIQDDNLELWEVYASAGDFGFPEHSRIVFHSLTDRTRRARALTRDLDRAAVERELSVLSDRELTGLLETAGELS